MTPIMRKGILFFLSICTARGKGSFLMLNQMAGSDYRDLFLPACARAYTLHCADPRNFSPLSVFLPTRKESYPTFSGKVTSGQPLRISRSLEQTPICKHRGTPTNLQGRHGKRDNGLAPEWGPDLLFHNHPLSNLYTTKWRTG